MKTKITLLAMLIAAQAFSQVTFTEFDLNPNGSSGARNFAKTNDKMFFAASNGDTTINILQLWSKSTTSAPKMISKFPKDVGQKEIDNVTSLNNKVYFTYLDELYVSDGTEAGTQLVKKINPNGSSAIYSLAVYNNQLFFSANYNGDYELWRSDGTASGTYLVKDINTAPNKSSDPAYFTTYNNKLYFSAVTEGRELWVTDGTTNGTKLVKDINIGTKSSNAIPEMVANGKLFFSALTDTTGRELYVTDGTPQGTVLVKDILPGPNSSYLGYPIAYKDRLYFTARDSDNAGAKLWVSDGTTAGTKKFGDIGINFFDPIIYNDLLYFSDGKPGGFWVTDGTPENTKMINNIFPIGGITPVGFINYRGKMYFSGFTNTDSQIWRTDGTAAGTEMLQPPIAPNLNPLQYSYLFLFDDALYFQAWYGSNGQELYMLKENSLGTVEFSPVKASIYPNPATDLVSISTSKTIESLQIINMSGQMVDTVNKPTNKQINVSKLTAGAYLVNIKYQNGETETTKLIKK